MIQESCWRQLESKQKWKPSGEETFLLANGQVQTALRRSDWECEVFGQKFIITLFVMKDSDLTFPSNFWEWIKKKNVFWDYFGFL